jgi:hypothetical protein
MGGQVDGWWLGSWVADILRSPMATHETPAHFRFTVIAVLATEAAVIVLLWLIGRYFAA